MLLSPFLGLSLCTVLIFLLHSCPDPKVYFTGSESDYPIFNEPETRWIIYRFPIFNCRLSHLLHLHQAIH